MDSYTQSSLVAHAECPQKYHWSYEYNGNGITPILPAHYLVSGDVGHRGVAMLYRSLSMNAVSNMVAKVFGEALAKGRHVSPDTIQQFRTQQEVIRAALYGYQRRYIKEIKGRTVVKIIGNEVPYKWQLETKRGTYEMTGVIDVHAENRRKRRAYIFETKFLSQISRTFQEDVEFSPQTDHYLIGAFESFMRSGWELRVIVNYIRKSGLRLKRGEGYRQFLERIREDYLQRPEHYFHRRIVRKTPGSILEAKRRMIAQISMLQYQKRTNYWYKNGRACNAKGRCWFFDLCNYGDRPGVMANFRNKTSRHEEIPETEG